MAKPRKREAPKAKGNGDLKEAIVLLPLTYNDGAEVPQETIDAICDEIFSMFHGWTIEGNVKGAYQMQVSGQKRVENLLKVSIILDMSRVSKLEEMVGRWCARLGQEVMLLKIADLMVKFVPPQPEAEQP
jgi:hypothetical protein